MKDVTVEYIRKEIKDIEACKGDFEAAHSMEDSLYEAVLKAISEGVENPAELAAEVLKAANMDFPRYCA